MIIKTETSEYHIEVKKGILFTRIILNGFKLRGGTLRSGFGRRVLGAYHGKLDKGDYTEKKPKDIRKYLDLNFVKGARLALRIRKRLRFFLRITSPIVSVE
ncbi:MAG: hypothetical protein KJ601_07705 [Nanoarchaeota archaeon]|nr:hypothetical protein [Nanoarchaeota archaeon]